MAGALAVTTAPLAGKASCMKSRGTCTCPRVGLGYRTARVGARVRVGARARARAKGWGYG